MTLNVDVSALAKLARLQVSEEELTKLQEEIPAILAFVDTVQGAPTPESNSATGLHNVMRADGNPHESGMHTAKLLGAAPVRDGNRIVVKQVVSRKK